MSLRLTSKVTNWMKSLRPRSSSDPPLMIDETLEPAREFYRNLIRDVTNPESSLSLRIASNSPRNENGILDLPRPKFYSTEAYRQQWRGARRHVDLLNSYLNRDLPTFQLDSGWTVLPGGERVETLHLIWK